MDKEKINKELSMLLVVFIMAVIIMQIVFYKESFFVNLGISASLIWILVLPGFAVMYYWEKDLDFLKRLLIGIALSAALVGISSYYLGIAGIHTKYHVFLPLVFIAIGISTIRKSLPLAVEPADKTAKQGKKDK